jgi:hypothetical protein
MRADALAEMGAVDELLQAVMPQAMMARLTKRIDSSIRPMSTSSYRVASLSSLVSLHRTDERGGRELPPVTV